MAYTLYPRLRRLRVSANLTTSRYIFNMYPFRCDNCQGEFEDISRRMDEFADRLFVNGRDRMKAVWTVPQAFGLETYWKRLPTGKEFIVQSLLGVNHGGLGIVPWEDPTPADIKASASSLALALPKMTPFIFNPTASFQRTTLNRVDIGLWDCWEGDARCCHEYEQCGSVGWIINPTGWCGIERTDRPGLRKRRQDEYQ